MEEKKDKKELSRVQQIERSISKKYRATLWSPFVAAIKRYQLIQENDKIAVCISGGKDSMLLAKMMQMLHRYSEVPFDIVYLVMDPGYNEVNLEKIKSNAALLEIPITIFKTDIFAVTEISGGAPCYLCAKMRRGSLYHKAQELGCNKIALGHHFSDVIETTVMSMFYASQLQAMLPKLHSQNFKGMTLIRPMYCIHEDDIISWMRTNELEFIRCACRVAEKNASCDNGSKRQEVKKLIQKLRIENPGIEKSIFNSIHAVSIETFPGFKANGEMHSFLERFDKE